MQSGDRPSVPAGTSGIASNPAPAAAGRGRTRQAKGRAVDPATRARVQALTADLPRRRDQLIECLHRVQDADGALSLASLAALAELLGLSQTEVFEVATFYHHFDVLAPGDTAPPGLTLRVCDSVSCALAGSAQLMDRLHAARPALEAAAAGRLRIQPVPCVGRCAQAPVAVVGRYPVESASLDTLREALAQGSREAPTPEAPDFETYRQQGGWASFGRLVTGELEPDAILAGLEASGLRGLGGAGFPTARKWRAVRAQPGPRLMAVNLDEGEPGTFKDRFFLETAPQQMLEGILIAACVVGCEAVYLYLRDEYAGVRTLLGTLLARLPAQLSAQGWGARLPRLELRRGAGAYICGEESAMIESIEGRRGMPRLRPPYVAEVGLFGRPTLVNNAETLYWIPEILRRGPEWFASQGRRGRRGLRAFSVSGRVRDPGVKLAPAGISARELIDEYCGGMMPGHTLYGFLPGGASGGILPAALAGEPLDFDTLAPHGAFIGSAAIVVLSQADRAREVAANLVAFFRHESCGQCTPCRVGTAKAETLLASPRWDTGLLGELSQVMRDASICGLGQAAPNPVDSVIRFFPQEIGQGLSDEEDS